MDDRSSQQETERTCTVLLLSRGVVLEAATLVRSFLFLDFLDDSDLVDLAFLEEIDGEDEDDGAIDPNAARN